MLVRRISLRSIRNSTLLVSLLLIAGGLGYWLGQHQLEVDLKTRSINIANVEVLNRQAPQRQSDVDFSLFWQVWDELERSFLDTEKLNPAEMVYGAIRGMTASLGDPYTAFLTPDENRQNKENLSGSFSGVGIQIGYKDRQLAVIAPLSGMPADRAGVEAGDYIVKIVDEGKGIDRETMGMSLPEAVSLIRGELGSKVTLSLFREGAEEPLDVTIIREEIVIDSVELEIIEPESGGEKFAHLIVSQFGDRTDAEWDEAVSKIISNSEITGVILDLRNNPGGYLDSSIYLTNEFLNEGTIVVKQGRYKSETFGATRKGKLLGYPLVVLIDEGSASASEIVAGSLRDRLKVTLIGETTFGKGTVQEARELPVGAGLHVTTSEWILPSGLEINYQGLKPDEVVEQVDDEDEVDEQLVRAMELLSGE